MLFNLRHQFMNKINAAVIIVVAFMLCGFALKFSNEVLAIIVSKLNSYGSSFPSEKIYLHLDKPIYAPGDDVWFKAYLVNGTTHRFDTLSKVIYVDLLDDRNRPVKQLMLSAPDGHAFGDIQLSDSLSEGRYVLRAYTNYMKNFDEAFFFHRELTIVNSVKPATSGDIHSIKIEFFPEGGNLIAGVENRIAFKAVASDGLGIDVQGEILDSSNKTVTAFKTDHNGMGMLRMIPWTNQNYTVRLLMPYKQDMAAEFPTAQESGYLIQISEMADQLRLVVYANVDRTVPGKGAVNVVAHTRGAVHFAARAELRGSSFITMIPKSKFPEGITHFTVFDDLAVPQCERLFFIRKKNDHSVSVRANKSEYGKREAVDLNIDINNNGRPVGGNYSVSVYDAVTLEESDDYPVNIENYLLLTSDLKGHIESPGYYFKDSLATTKYHLDLVMMTHGWRRFVWKQVINDEFVHTYLAEKGIPFSGTLLKVASNQPAAGASLKIMTQDMVLITVEADSLGRFYTDLLSHYDTMLLAIQTDNVKGKSRDLKFKFHPFQPYVNSQYSATTFYEVDASAFLHAQKQQENLDRLFQTPDVKLLKAVEISSDRMQERRKDAITLYRNVDQTIENEDFAQRYTDVASILRGRVPGLQVAGVFPDQTVTLRGRPTIFF
jgi:hypothetical protein